ncbi:hypothetical protein [Rhizobium wuzhouense]|uniref:Uncharacterized protein n=1 Tax=Rhizobium wuzhouense TaxID=1986026 RepID=A0ABX5NV02_9HYPH|nr:hypothetical protein [Rhizobium wuzhouense]PYB77003.1 hypothetical protein DMY87_01015 [Rhizobium wuzhouense]
MKSKLQTWSLIVGMVMLGPAMLGLSITMLIIGEIPGRHGVLVRAEDSPAVFYIAVAILIALTMKLTQLTLIAARLLYRSARQQSEQ